MTWTETATLSLRHVNYLLALLNEEQEPDKPKHAPPPSQLPNGVKRVPVMT
jgi:hypothetical protein